MKNITFLFLCMFFANSAFASIFVNLENPGGAFTGFSNGDSNGEAFVQLVWNDGSTVESGSGINVDLENGFKADGDYILTSFTTTPGYQGTWSDLGDKGGLFGDTNVGDLDILDGYLTVRLFDANDMVDGSKGFVFDIDIDGALSAFNASDPSTIYKTLGLITGGDFSSLVSGQAGVVTVIPEPATLLIFGPGIAGLLAYRRRKNGGFSFKKSAFSDLNEPVAKSTVKRAKADNLGRMLIAIDNSFSK